MPFGVIWHNLLIPEAEILCSHSQTHSGTRTHHSGICLSRITQTHSGYQHTLGNLSPLQKASFFPKSDFHIKSIFCSSLSVFLINTTEFKFFPPRQRDQETTDKFYQYYKVRLDSKLFANNLFTLGCKILFWISMQT